MMTTCASKRYKPSGVKDIKHRPDQGVGPVLRLCVIVYGEDKDLYDSSRSDVHVDARLDVDAGMTHKSCRFLLALS